MANSVVWFDVPVTDLDRAIRWYSAVLGRQVEKEQMAPEHGGTAIGVLPHEGKDVGGCLVVMKDTKPSASGPLLYLNCQGRLDEAIAAAQKEGGRVLQPRQPIGQYGFRAVVIDSEGNRLALHST